MKMLKCLGFSLVMTLFLVGFSCERTDCCVMPAAAELHGNWEFVRIHYGFTNTTRTAMEVGYTERLEINGAKSHLRRLRNGKEVESTAFSLTERDNSNVITFEAEQTYSYYTIFEEEGKTILSLYERSPVGAMIADGGVYYYEKK